jgi:hypothetical protein
MVERLPDPDGTFASYTPTAEDNFREIAKALYHRIVEPFKLAPKLGTINLRDVPSSSATHGVLKGLGIEIQSDQTKLDVSKYPEISDFIEQFAAPIQAIASGSRMPLTLRNAPLAKAMLDRVSADVSEASFVAEQAIAQANSTSGFWEWVARQTQQRASEHPRVAASGADQGRSGR